MIKAVNIIWILTENINFVDNPAEVVCESIKVSGETIANGNYDLWKKQTHFDPQMSSEDIRSNSTKSIKVPIYKHTKKALVIFYKPGGDGWRIGREASIKNGSYLFKSKSCKKNWQ